MAALPADPVDPALNLEAFPFFYSDEFSEITEEDYLRAEPDVNYILPDAQARLTTRRDLLAELAFALLNRESPDYIAEEHPPRVRNLTYNNHVTSETWLQWRKSSAPASRKLKLSNLKGLVDLPFEILALIFDDLHPIDYLHLAQTCKHLRFFFSSRANRSLWRAAFLRFERIPECPPDFIEPRWAAFMWGKDSCDVCGGIKSAPEWNLRRRLCNPCLEANTIKPDENAGPAFAYLPASADGERYWQEDVLETEMEFEKFTIRASVEGYMAEMEMTMYMDQKTALLLLIKEHGDICRRWARHLHNDHDARQDKKKEAVVKRIRTLFRLEGHHKDDADQATITIDDDEKIAHRYLTRYHFNDLRPRFTDAIQEACRNRLQREHDRAVIDRGWAITERVNEWMRSNPAWTWGYQPYNNAFVKNFPHIFQDLVDAEGSAPITTDDMVTAFEKVDEEIVKWRLKKMEELADMLPEEEYVHDLYNEGMSEKANIGSLELATAVFDCECGGGHAYVGWDEAGEHISACTIQFSRRGADAAKSLVELVGLNPKTTSATTMDNMGDRFICGACPVERRGRVTGRVARDWRDTILHYVESSEDEAHSIPSWLLLSKMATRDVLLRETRPDDHSREWACCHCGRNWLTNHDTKPETKEHLRDEHDITRPVNGLDMHLYQKYRRPRGGHALLAESILYRCNYCPLSDKLLTKDQLDKHVKGKAHAVLRPGDAEILVKTIENVTVHYPSTELEVEQPKDSTDGDGQ